MKHSRRAVLTMMGSGAMGAGSMGFVERRDRGRGFLREATRGGRTVATCPGATHGGFGRWPHRFHGHGHAHGGG